MAKKPLPTPEELRQLLRYEPETGKLFWRERPVGMFSKSATPQTAANRWNGRCAGELAGSPRRDGYIIVRIFGRGVLAHRAAFAIMRGRWPVGDIDHINGRTGDNRACNMREVDRTTNMRNACRPSDNASGAVGVYWSLARSKWVANIRVAKKTIYLGCFDDFAAAVSARKAAERKYDFSTLHGRPPWA